VARLSRLIAIVGLALGVAVACSDDGGIAGFNKSGKKKSSKTKGGGDSIGDDDDSSASTRTIDNSGQLQVKDVVLLKNSIKSCMGEGMTTIHGGMLLPKLDAGGAPAGEPAQPALKLTQGDVKFAFLLPTDANKEGADIVDVERTNLVDLSHSSRTSIASDSLTDTYLRSMEIIANVVAFNCDASKKECSCGTKELAQEMLTRCLPSLDPHTKEMEEAATMLGNVCKKGDSGMRKAIASMIASYAFAAAR
jgi:hypothetical protein